MNFNVHKFLKHPPGRQGCQDRMQTDKCIQVHYKMSEIIPLSGVGEAPQSNIGKQCCEWKCEAWGKRWHTDTEHFLVICLLGCARRVQKPLTCKVGVNRGGWAGVFPSENGIRNVQREEASMALWCWVSHGDVHKNWCAGNNTNKQAQKSYKLSVYVWVSLHRYISQLSAKGWEAAAPQKWEHLNPGLVSKYRSPLKRTTTIKKNGWCWDRKT